MPHRIFSCGMWDLVPRPGIEPRPPALGAQSLSDWTYMKSLHEVDFNSHFANVETRVNFPEYTLLINGRVGI